MIRRRLETSPAVNRKLPNGVELVSMQGAKPPMDAREAAGWIMPGHPGRGEEASWRRSTAVRRRLGRLAIVEESSDSTA